MKQFEIEIINQDSGIYVKHIVFATSAQEANLKLQKYLDSLSEMNFWRMKTTTALESQ